MITKTKISLDVNFKVKNIELRDSVDTMKDEFPEIVKGMTDAKLIRFSVKGMKNNIPKEKACIVNIKADVETSYDWIKDKEETLHYCKADVNIGIMNRGKNAESYDLITVGGKIIK